ncbi:hypothetical protein DSO57_1010005 [Entomophthora muscae]|uniref:Uncharacterized protein n=1 Tax=Entomophthora muscae TaxID=34485 RepID=A0ACC2S8K3_9FUNG|nr:hypothetical protein DSO57_1010005 [Entomophthora muscae]
MTISEFQEEKDTETKRQSPNPSLENKLKREERIIQLFKKISGTDGTSDLPYPKGITVDDIHRHFEKRHGKSAYIYAKELVSMADKANDGIVDYEEFRLFVIRQEKALWRLFRKMRCLSRFQIAATGNRGISSKSWHKGSPGKTIRFD